MFVDLLLLATLLMLEADALVRENGNVSFLFYSLVAASNLTLIYTETTINPSQGRLPALGWNSWNAFECDIDAVKIMVAANHMVNLGLKDVGYEYVNIDDCWSVKYARNASNNRIIPDPGKFPNGIVGVAEQVHALGLKIGIYSSAGETTCAGYPASLGYETVDAEAFAEWGIDYLKYDDCGVPPEWKDEYTGCVPDSDEDPSSWNFPNGTCPDLVDPAPEGYDWTTSKTHQRYINMRDALLNVNRTILYSLCDMGHANVNTWGNSTGNSWRITNDIKRKCDLCSSHGYPAQHSLAEWVRISEIANENTFLLDYVDFWGHPDPDMLEVGNGNLTLAENRAHFALWAIMKSPLLIGTPVCGINYLPISAPTNMSKARFDSPPTSGHFEKQVSACIPPGSYHWTPCSSL
ncbi:unnamed protein product [Penicillium olsonii]|nr:unnamed protein product [Penicillium olsonii]